jgi:Protein of unknown function (DUF3185)
MKTVVEVIGLALLILGGVIIVYGFNSPDLVNSRISGILNGMPTIKGMASLWGGSAAAVAGVCLAVRRSNRT